MNDDAIDHIQRQLKQALLRKQWQRATTLMKEYDHLIAELRDTPDTIPEAMFTHYAAENRKLIQQLQQAITHISEDIADIDRGIHRLERGKQLLTEMDARQT